MPNLPVPVRDPSLVRAAVSPTAVAVTAAGVGIGVLDHSVIVAVVLGAGAWCVRMVAGGVRRARRRRAAQPRPAALDPWSVPEPWRPLVRHALEAQNRFDQTLRDWDDGPIKDRLRAIQPRVWADVESIGKLAHRGAVLSGEATLTPAPERADPNQLGQQLLQVQAERARAGVDSEKGAALARTEEAIAAQIRASHHSRQAGAVLLDRLRVVVARLDETVTSLLLVGVDARVTSSDALAQSLEDINEEIMSLGQGLEETVQGGPFLAPEALPAPNPPPAR